MIMKVPIIKFHSDAWLYVFLLERHLNLSGFFFFRKGPEFIRLAGACVVLNNDQIPGSIFRSHQDLCISPALNIHAKLLDIHMLGICSEPGLINGWAQV